MNHVLGPAVVLAKVYEAVEAKDNDNDLSWQGEAGNLLSCTEVEMFGQWYLRLSSLQRRSPHGLKEEHHSGDC